MAVRVADLLGLPHLRLELLAGDRGTNAIVHWAQTSDLDAPWEFMTEGELLMKNGRTLPSTTSAQVTFLRGIADVRICGLVIGMDQMTPRLSPKALATADELRMPIIKIPYSVSFASVAKAVAYATETDDARRLALTERVYNTIRTTVAGTTREAALRQLSRDLACRLAVLDAETGEVALEGTPPAPDFLRDRLVAEVRERSGAIPGVIHLSVEGMRGLAVEVPDEEPTALLTYDFRAETPDTVLLQHIATAVAVLLAQQGIRREYDRRVGGELLAQLVDGRIDRVTAGDRLKRRGINPKSVALVAIVGGSDIGQRHLHTTLNRRNINHLLLRRSEVLYALLPPTEDNLSLLRRRLGEDSLIGVSDPVGTYERIPAASHEAVWAARVAPTEPDRIARYRDATLLSVLRDASEARAVVDRILGVLLDYDAEHDSDMVETVDTFLRCQRSWQKTAAELNIHRQTVIYRIKRVEDITGRNLSESAHIAELWLALRARELTALPG